MSYLYMIYGYTYNILIIIIIIIIFVYIEFYICLPFSIQYRNAVAIYTALIYRGLIIVVGLHANANFCYNMQRIVNHYNYIALNLT